MSVASALARRAPSPVLVSVLAVSPAAMVLGNVKLLLMSPLAPEVSLRPSTAAPVLFTTSRRPFAPIEKSSPLPTESSQATRSW